MSTEAIQHVDVFPQMRFIEFKRTRAQRGAPAARVHVRWSSEANDCELLWMDEQDLLANIGVYGECQAFHEALVAYGSRKK